MKIVFITPYPTFIQQLMQDLRAIGYECEHFSHFDKNIMPRCDVIWADFACEEAIKVQEYLTPAIKILRIHRYECYTDLITAIVPSAWDKIIFVNEAYKLKVEEVLGKLKNAVVLPNYLNPDNYKYPEDKKPNNKIAIAGFINARKGIDVVCMLAQEMSEYEFHIVGKIQDYALWDYIKINSPKNIYWYEWTDDLVSFFADKTYYLNTSIAEAQSVSVTEAMLCGLKPLVRNWFGATNIYRPEYIWSNPTQLKEMFNYENHELYRKLAVDFLKPIESYVDLFNREPKKVTLPSLTIAIVKTRNKFLPQLLNSLEYQNYPITVDILDNMDKDKSIGKCFNILADRCKTEWICYVGDDDILSENYVLDVMNGYLNRKDMYNNVVGLLTGAIYFDDNNNRTYSSSFPTGFWKTDFVRRIRFNEQIIRQVDTEFIERINLCKDEVIMRMDWIVGYLYRQHSNNISGNKYTEGANNKRTE